MRNMNRVRVHAPRWTLVFAWGVLALMLGTALVSDPAEARRARRDNAELIKAFDSDGDGKISKEEWRGRSPHSQFDVNGDGFLTLEELNERRPNGRVASSAANTAFDGKWEGSVKVRNSDCAQYGLMSLQVSSGDISGELTIDSNQRGSLKSGVTGEVGPGGNAKLKFHPNGEHSRRGGMRGTFSNNEFKGTMGGNCPYEVSLKKQ